MVLQRRERVFQQDLNGDGVVGPRTTTLEAYGSSRLNQVANEFFLYNSGGSGPSSRDGSGEVVDGEFGAWKAIGAEKTASGYEVALKYGTADQYVVWNTDGNGNYIGGDRKSVM